MLKLREDQIVRLGQEIHGNFERRCAEFLDEYLPDVRVQLTKIEALSLAEASARSGMSMGALKVATHRAVQSLRRQFGMHP